MCSSMGVSLTSVTTDVEQGYHTVWCVWTSVRVGALDQAVRSRKRALVSTIL